MTKSVAFRLDASHLIGSGHFMRCLTLADALFKKGINIRFICRYLPDSLHSMLEKSSHEIVLLPESIQTDSADELAHSHFLGVSQTVDAKDTLEALSDRLWDWVIVDHYGIDARWHEVLRKVTKQIMVIDDIADRTHDCELLLDQNLYSDMQSRYNNRVSIECCQLIGPSYCLLRQEFSELRRKLRSRTGKVERILVFFGGIDPDNYTGRSIEVIQSLGMTVHVDVVIGGDNPHLMSIKEICEASGYDLHIQTPRMGELMASADLALGAGGSASWERCCLGLATISVAFAENQFDIAHALHDVGACVFLGDGRSVTQEKIKETLSKLVYDSQKLNDMSNNAYSLVDGIGTERVCEAIELY
jgi:UDP-2,4-diacetamido-2,4,6-trideoxy-beta-L-altropyranose hydrolase